MDTEESSRILPMESITSEEGSTQKTYNSSSKASHFKPNRVFMDSEESSRILLPERLIFEDETTSNAYSSTLRTSRFKPNRVCVIAVAVPLTIIIILFHIVNHTSHTKETPLEHKGTEGRVTILIDNKSPLNVTIMSDSDSRQTSDSGRLKVEIIARQSLENKTECVRLTRSHGAENDVHLTYRPDLPTPTLPRRTNLDEIKPNTQNIFFIETRCGTKEQMKKHLSYSGVVMNARQMCAVESTARMNPSRPVYILHTCPLASDFCQRSPKFVQEVLRYPNVHIVQLDLEEFFLRTNVEGLYFGGRFEKSRHPIEHVSDVVRLLTLWRFGGTYMDIDVVSIKPLDALGTNYAGWQDERTIATGVLNFEPSGFGHQILTECLDHLRFNYDTEEWSTNGPILLTNTIMRLLDQDKGNERRREFTAYPINVFYPLYYTEWRAFFEEKMGTQTLNRLNDTYVVHIWNRMSSQEEISVGSGQAYGVLADKYCPKSYWNCGRTF